MTTRRAITLLDVARRAGVSAATASRVLNGSTRTVGGDNAARVLTAAAELGYAADPSAQATVRRSTGTVALVVNDIADPYFSSLAAGVLDRADEADLIVTTAVADRTAAQQLRIVSTLRGHRPHAIILAGSRFDDPHDAVVDELGAYSDFGGRVALISQPGLPFPTVSIDDFGAARDFAHALACLGYRRCAVVCGPAWLRVSRDRREGFLAGLAQTPAVTCQVLETDFTEDGGYTSATRLPADTDLVFAVTDLMAIGVMRGLRDAGTTPGDGVAVAGFGDIDAAQDVGLTTVRLPLREMGRHAMDMALSGAAQDEVRWLPTTPVLRSSTPRRQRW